MSNSLDYQHRVGLTFLYSELTQHMMADVTSTISFSKIRSNCLPVSIISFLPLTTLHQFPGYVLAHHFRAQPHEQKRLNHL